jgi:hypothetical protein
MQRVDRPFGVSLLAFLALLAFVGGLIGLLGALAGSAAGVAVGLVLVVLGGASAYGLWNLRSWAWPLTFVLYVLASLDAVRLLLAGTLNSNLVVGPLVLFYLFRPDIKRLFGRA